MEGKNIVFGLLGLFVFLGILTTALLYKSSEQSLYKNECCVNIKPEESDKYGSFCMEIFISSNETRVPKHLNISIGNKRINDNKCLELQKRVI